MEYSRVARWRSFSHSLFEIIDKCFHYNTLKKIQILVNHAIIENIHCLPTVWGKLGDIFLVLILGSINRHCCYNNYPIQKFRMHRRGATNNPMMQRIAHAQIWDFAYTFCLSQAKFRAHVHLFALTPFTAELTCFRLVHFGQSTARHRCTCVRLQVSTPQILIRPSWGAWHAQSAACAGQVGEDVFV